VGFDTVFRVKIGARVQFLYSKGRKMEGLGRNLSEIGENRVTLETSSRSSINEMSRERQSSKIEVIRWFLHVF
jgi:hypothetical protein